MKSMKRVLAMLLCVVLVIGLIPASVMSVLAAEDAAGDPVVVIAGSDYQLVNSGTIMTNIMYQIKGDYDTAYGVLMGGDYDAGSVSTKASHIEAVDNTISNVFPEMAAENRVYIQGNHENFGGLKPSSSNLMTTEHVRDTAHYGVYAINHDDFPWTNSSNPAPSEALVQATANALGDYLEAKIAAGYAKPIFVLSHLPLHATTRGDNRYAKLIFDELEAAGEAGLNIIFLVGHNHSGGYDQYLGNGSFYLPKGSNLTVVEGTTNTYTDSSISFTYMNYGYLGKISGGACTHQTMTAFAITDDKVTVKRYAEGGTHKLKEAGVAVSGYNTDTNVIGIEGATIMLTTPTVEEKVTVENADKTVSVSAPDLTGLTVVKTVGTADNTEKTYSAFASYDITPEGYIQGKTATVTITLDAVDGFDASRKVVVIDEEKGTETEKSIESGKVTFTTNHFSTYSIGQKAVPAAATGNVYTLVDTIEDGGEYLIVSANSGSAYALRNPGGSSGGTDMGATAVTIENGTITTDDTDVIWRATANGTRFNLTNGTDYLEGKSGNVSIFSTQQYADRGWNYEGNQLKHTGGSNTYVVYCSGNSFTSTYNDTDETVYFFKRGGGSSVTPDANGWVTITAPVAGETTYTYTQATSITADEEYVIVGNNNPVALMDNSGQFGSQTVTISGSTMTSTTALTEWTFSGTSSSTIYNGTRYLRYINNSFSLNQNSSTTFTITDNGSNFRIQSGNYSFYYNGSSWTRSGRNTAQYIRLYQLTNTSSSGGTNGQFAKITGTMEHTVARGLSAEEVIAQYIKDIQGYLYEGPSAPGSDVTGTDITSQLTYTMQEGYSGTVAGDYYVTVYYGEHAIGSIKITVPEVAVTGVELISKEGTVTKGATKPVSTGATLKINYEDGTSSEPIAVTVGMLSGEFTTATVGTYPSLTVSYTVGETTYTCDDLFTLNVVRREGNDYPEYPDPGSVNVNKTADATYLQQAGVVNVELSTSGLPMNQGVDVLLVLDTSSSMNEAGSLTSGTRLEVLKDCVDNMIANLRLPRTDGSLPDIDFAVVDFNGYMANKAVNYIGSTAKSTSDLGEVVTNGWMDIMDDAFAGGNWADNNIKVSSGTNYDHGLQLAYQMLSEKQATDPGRKQFVLFMSDGSPFMYNGVGSSETGEGNDYEKWLLGSYTQDEVNAINTIVDKDFYYGNNNGNGQKHWIAEAIKGSVDEMYPIATYSDTTANADGSLQEFPGLGATLYTVGFALDNDYGRNPTSEAGLISILTVMASEGLFYDVDVAEDLEAAFDDFSGAVLFAATNAYFVDQLGDSFDLQMTTTVNARNESGELEQTTLSQLTGGALTAPKIQVRNYNIYKASDENGTTVTADMVGKRYGDPVVMEEVTFTDDGNGNVTGVYSNQIDGGSTNILGENGVISAKYFYYNTSSTIQTVNGIRLEPETFRWNIGTINNVEWALSYYTYLTGSMEGNTSSGSYKTNNYATLYYTNWLDNDVQQDTTSPQTGWKSANVSYGFYLVDSLGRPVVNQTTGETGNFINAVKVTQPVVFDEIMLNNLDDIDTIEAQSVAILPSGYDLYDTAASYKVVILSADGKGSWTITSSKTPQTTYVTGHAGSDVSNVEKVTSNNKIEGMTDYQLETGYDYTHTTVWFAVVWVPKTIPDAVVVDYGLPVDISVLENDQFGLNGSLSGVGKTDDKETILENANNPLYTGEHSALFTDKVSATYGDAETFGKKIRYTPKTMSWGDGEVSFDRFSYEVKYEQYNYSDKDNPVHMATQYYYGDVSVIPATTVYYEDSFVDLKSFTVTRDENGKAVSEAQDTTSKWVADRTATNITQGEDRPGKYSSADIDKNQVYGYDAAYTTMSEHSLDKAAKITVNANTRGEAYFTFYGTGFDVISMTSNTTGTMTVQVYAGAAATGTPVKTMMVDTYYGYTKDAKGNWVVNNSVENSLYQIPVIKIAGLTYDQYTVKITAGYNNFFNHTATAGAYDLYLDAIRIYDPAGAGDDLVFNEEGEDRDMTIADIYAQDGEGWPRYEELRNQLISEDTYKSASDTSIYKGAIFIDGNDTNLSVADYTSYGPNNEVYLAKGQAVAFELDLSSYIRTKTINDKQVNVSIVADTQIGVKSADGSPVKVTLSADNVSATREFQTTTDMYYSFSQMIDLGTDVTGEDTANDSKTVITISNTGASGVVSITNLKITFKENPNGTQQTEVPMLLSMSRSTGERALMMLRAPAVEDEIPEETVPEVTEPEVTEPEVTEPEATEPEVTEPEATEPEVTEPEVTEPEVTEPEATEPEVTEPEESKPQVTPEQVASAITNVVKKVVNALSNLFGRWFR